MCDYGAVMQSMKLWTGLYYCRYDYSVAGELVHDIVQMKFLL